MPISVTNEIRAGLFRPSCNELANPMMTPEQIDAPAANAAGIMFAPGDATQVEAKGANGKDSKDGKDVKGLGSGAGAVKASTATIWMGLAGAVAAFLV